MISDEKRDKYLKVLKNDISESTIKINCDMLNVSYDLYLEYRDILKFELDVQYGDSELISFSFIMDIKEPKLDIEYIKTSDYFKDSSMFVKEHIIIPYYLIDEYLIRKISIMFGKSTKNNYNSIYNTLKDFSDYGRKEISK